MLKRWLRLRRFCQKLVFLFAGTLVVGCGTMKIDETHYYSVPSKDGDNVNVYRLHVTGETTLSKTKYKSGWYPASAVDRLFGNVSSDGNKSNLQAREEIENIYREAMVKATQAYMSVALNPKSSQEEISQAMEVRRRALFYPTLDKNVPDSSVIVDYNPSKGVAYRHANDKMVFILSANPDVVVGNIQNFSESDKTALAVSRLAQVTSLRVRNDVMAEEAKDEVDRVAIKTQLEQSIAMLKNAKSATDKNQIIEQINILITFLEGMR